MPLKRRKARTAPPANGCPLAACSAFIGGAWTPHVIWYLAGGPRRFSELKSDIRGVSSKVLSARLRELEEFGVVTRTVMPTSPPTVEYALTELGGELMPVIEKIVEVGFRLVQRQRAA